MTHTDDRPTLEERYSRAVHSSRLVVEERHRGDADFLIAAGWTAASLDDDGNPVQPSDAKRRDQLAIALYRLACEFDGVRAETRGRGPLNAAEALLILSRLKGLSDARRQLGAYATIRATKWQFMRPDAEVAILVGQVLDVWLDPGCRHCDGRGFVGGGRHEHSQVAHAICRPCRGTGKRRHKVGRDPEQSLYAARLLTDMDSMLSAVEAGMRHFLRSPAA